MNKAVLDKNFQNLKQEEKEKKLVEQIEIYNKKFEESGNSDKYTKRKLEDLNLGLSFQRKYKKFKERDK